jgi:hypothetical protein
MSRIVIVILIYYSQTNKSDFTNRNVIRSVARGKEYGVV